MAEQDRMDAILHAVGQQARADLPLDEWKQSILENARRAKRMRRMRSITACAATFVVLLGGVGLLLGTNGAKSAQNASAPVYTTMTTAEAAPMEGARAYDGDMDDALAMDAMEDTAPAAIAEESAPMPSAMPEAALFDSGTAFAQDALAGLDRCEPAAAPDAASSDGLTVSMANDLVRQQAQSVIEHNWPSAVTLSVTLRSDESYLAVVDPGESDEGLLFVFFNKDMEIAE